MRAHTSLNWTIKAVALTTLIVGVAGCGGGGSPSAPITATNALRTLQSGDAWTYKVSGKLTDSNGTVSSLKSGSYVRSIQNVPGGAGLSLTEADSLLFANGTNDTTTRISYFAQDSGQNISQTDDNFETSGNFEFAKTPTSQVVIPGVWNAQTGISSAAEYDVPINTTTTDSSGVTTTTTTYKVTNQEQFAITVIGQENIVTSIGTFQTWKTTETARFVTQGLTISSTGWWSPKLGSYVKLMSTRSTGTSTEEVTYDLTSTTVAH